MSLRSPLSEARGLGAAKEGTHHWFIQRISAVAMAPLMLWLLFSLAALAGSDYVAVRGWVASPLNTALLLVLIATLFHHALLGTQVVIEDYVASEGKKMAALIATRFVLIVAAVLGIVAILKISLGA
ncbi:succinate dehydrogenase, hydrophobic membrane anchor protein [Algiphilus aromaticivorans]|jgi:succinate dehydrogenase / fumarate reductase membrane anchor subunit|uniref:succinate dehydrogenase, hydrophobic membrane anchor protein n=1 Tax=Algiphilus aromaticivorans TaxID=382454 RepID=UPI0005C157DA|nr:succinate dehydrogenase, hydrophobic membrane anchor protein [Algiphilus aromaticivorans]